MNRKQEMIEELKASRAQYVGYGESDLSYPVLREDAISDIEGMDDEMIGEGTWTNLIVIKSSDIKATKINEAIKEIEIKFPNEIFKIAREKLLGFSEACEAVAIHIVYSDTDFVFAY